MDPDVTLASRLGRGDATALETLHGRYGGRIRRLCRNLLRNDADAEDATQDVLIKAFERAPQFGGRSRLSTWIYRIAVNHCLQALERARVRLTEALPEASPGHPAAATPAPLEAVSAADERRRAQELLARLPEEQRVALLLREVDGLSYREIAEALGVPVGMVMSRLARARERLAARVRESRAALESRT